MDSSAGLFYAKDAPLWSTASTSASLERPRPRKTTLSPAKKKPKTDMRDELLVHMNESDTTNDQEVDKERKKNMKTKKSKKKKNNKKAINIEIVGFPTKQTKYCNVCQVHAKNNSQIDEGMGS